VESRLVPDPTGGTIVVGVDGSRFRVLGNEVSSWVTGERQRFAFSGRSGRPPSKKELSEATQHAPFLVESKDPWTHGNPVAARHCNGAAS
jgi:hypothetical protein